MYKGEEMVSSCLHPKNPTQLLTFNAVSLVDSALLFFIAVDDCMSAALRFLL